MENKISKWRGGEKNSERQRKNEKIEIEKMTRE